MSVTWKQENAICALLAHPTIGEAAAAAGVSERTLFRWLQEDGFRQRYREARREAVSSAIARLQQVAASAVVTLEEVMKDSEAPASVRVTAARVILDMSLRVVELEDLETRISELEARIGGVA